MVVPLSTHAHTEQCVSVVRCAESLLSNPNFSPSPAAHVPQAPKLFMTRKYPSLMEPMPSQILSPAPHAPSSIADDLTFRCLCNGYGLSK